MARCWYQKIRPKWIKWVEYFAEYASNWGLDFDAYDLTSSPEWKILTEWVMTQIEKMK